MKISLRDKWCRALRGQDGVVYQQGKDWLRTQDDKYCCLGVLLDITGAEWSKAVGKKFDDDLQLLEETPIFVSSPLGCEGMISQDDMEELGISDDTCVELAMLNDEGETFLEIADRIERNSLNNPIDLEGDDSEQPGAE